VAGSRPAEINGGQAVELSAMAEDMLRSALPPADRDAFDDAPRRGGCSNLRLASAGWASLRRAGEQGQRGGGQVDERGVSDGQADRV